MELLRAVGEAGEQRVSARLLDTDRRTVRACLGSGELTRRMRVALERLLLERTRLRPRWSVSGSRRLRRDWRRWWERWATSRTTWLLCGGSTSRPYAASAGGCPGWRSGWAQHERVEAKGVMTMQRNGGRSFREAKTFPPRAPDIVTKEPSPDDEEVYGAAWSLVNEWRGLRAKTSPAGKGADMADRRRAHPGAGGCDAEGAPAVAGGCVGAGAA